jgi:hypothetical protein
MAAVHTAKSVVITILTILYIVVRSLRIRTYSDFHYPSMTLISNFELIKNRSAESEVRNNRYSFHLNFKIL